MSEATMTDTARTGLMVIVERAVRPARVPLARKMKMREELFSHLAEVLEEERSRTGDEKAALAQASRRFGDPREIATELQATVPGYERPFYWIERFTERRPGEAAWRRAARWAVLIAALNAGSIAASFLPLAARGDGPLEVAFRVVAAFAAGSAVMTFAVVLLGESLRHAAFGRPESRSPFKSAAVLAAAALLPLAVTALLNLIMLESVSEGVAFLRRTITNKPLFLFLPVVPAILLLATWQIEKERRRITPWTGLQID